MAPRKSRPDYETQTRLKVLKGEPLEPDEEPSPSYLVLKAKKTLGEVMEDHDAKASERVMAADSVLDRWSDPRKKFELGGSRTVNIQLPPDAMTSALGALAQVFKKGEIVDVPPSPPPGPLPLPSDEQGAPPS